MSVPTDDALVPTSRTPAPPYRPRRPATAARWPARSTAPAAASTASRSSSCNSPRTSPRSPAVHSRRPTPSPTTSPDEVPAVRPWLLADDADQAAADLADLCAWVGRVYLRYPRTDLPTCWLWHPHAVEELWWLRRAHADAYHPRERLLAARRGLARPSAPRRHPAPADAIGSCELALHLPGQRAAGAPRPVPFGDLAAAVAQTWTGSDGRQPGPAADAPPARRGRPHPARPLRHLRPEDNR